MKKILIVKLKRCLLSYITEETSAFYLLQLSQLFIYLIKRWGCSESRKRILSHVFRFEADRTTEGSDRSPSKVATKRKKSRGWNELRASEAESKATALSTTDCETVPFHQLRSYESVIRILGRNIRYLIPHAARVVKSFPPFSGSVISIDVEHAASPVCRQYCPRIFPAKVEVVNVNRWPFQPCASFP